MSNPNFAMSSRFCYTFAFLFICPYCFHKPRRGKLRLWGDLRPFGVLWYPSFLYLLHIPHDVYFGLHTITVLLHPLKRNYEMAHTGSDSQIRKQRYINAKRRATRWVTRRFITVLIWIDLIFNASLLLFPQSTPPWKFGVSYNSLSISYLSSFKIQITVIV